MRLVLAVLIASLTALSPAQARASAPFTIAETGQGFGTLAAAVQAIGAGTGTIVIAPGVYRECAVQSAGVITYRAANPGTVIFEGVTCEDKAALVLRGQGSTIDGIIFRGYRVRDGNGAGIRTEAGDLTVRNAMFLDSQEGILGRQDAAQRVLIDHSTFAGLGQCDETPGCAHSIYLANRGQVSVTNSRFERGTGGHYVKLRVPNAIITDNSFDDTRGRKTNYMIDLSEGGSGLIARNTFVQGRDKENWSALIVVAAEAQTYSANGLRIIDNDARLAPGDTRSPAFVANVSRDRLAIGANRLGPRLRLFEQR